MSGMNTGDYGETYYLGYRNRFNNRYLVLLDRCENEQIYTSSNRNLENWREELHEELEKNIHGRDVTRRLLNCIRKITRILRQRARG